MKYREELIDSKLLEKAEGVAVVCGKVSGNLECIDVDAKYDVAGMATEFFKLIGDLGKKLVVQSTQNKGYHLIYRCEEPVGPNVKLSMRLPQTGEKNKFVTVIETRGEGGYFLIDPTPGYKITRGSLLNLPVLTSEERDFLFTSARSLNEYFVEHTPPGPKKELDRMVKSPFDDFNARGDVIGLLVRYGWEYVEMRASRHLLRRPGASSRSSGNWNEELGWFSVFSTNTEFEVEKAYRPYAVYAILECGGDFGLAAKKLLEEGYGERYSSVPPPTPISKPDAKISIEDEDFSFISDGKQAINVANKYRTGELIPGRSTGFKELDQYFLVKKADFVTWIGHANVGKTAFILYLITAQVKQYKEPVIVYLAENKEWQIRVMIIGYLAVKRVKEMDQEEFTEWNEFINKYFIFIKNTEVYTYVDLLNAGEKILKKRDCGLFFIDPYSALDKDHKEFGRFNSHEYDYKAASMMLNFGERTGCGIWLSIHTTTEAMRRYDKDGFQLVPNAADVEGGAKFINRADDVVVLHRKLGHESDWNKTEVHVRKIRVTETGGKPMSPKSPILFEMINGVKFVDPYGQEPFKYKSFQGGIDFTQARKSSEFDDMFDSEIF